MIADRRSVDGGWNYGNRRVYKTDLPSYPETTGIALLGLQGSQIMDMKPSLALAEKYWRERLRLWPRLGLESRCGTMD